MTVDGQRSRLMAVLCQGNSGDGGGKDAPAVDCCEQSPCWVRQRAIPLALLCWLFLWAADGCVGAAVQMFLYKDVARESERQPCTHANTAGRSVCTRLPTVTVQQRPPLPRLCCSHSDIPGFEVAGANTQRVASTHQACCPCNTHKTCPHTTRILNHMASVIGYHSLTTHPRAHQARMQWHDAKTAWVALQSCSSATNSRRQCCSKQSPMTQWEGGPRDNFNSW